MAPVGSMISSAWRRETLGSPTAISAVGGAPDDVAPGPERRPRAGVEAADDSDSNAGSTRERGHGRDRVEHASPLHTGLDERDVTAGTEPRGGHGIEAGRGEEIGHRGPRVVRHDVPFVLPQHHLHAS